MHVVHTYSLSSEGNKKVAANFKVREFRCRDGADLVIISPELVEVLQKARDHFGKPLNINSAFRTPAHNKKVGGVSNSRHMFGVAADCYINGVSPEKLYAYFTETYPGKYGVGLYDTFVHIDMREIKSRWDYRNK